MQTTATCIRKGLLFHRLSKRNETNRLKGHLCKLIHQIMTLNKKKNKAKTFDGNDHLLIKRQFRIHLRYLKTLLTFCMQWTGISCFCDG